MTGVLQALRKCDVRCHAPSSTGHDIESREEELVRYTQTGFEKPRPSKVQVAITEALPNTGLLFQYFLDGSMRTTAAGHVVDVKNRFLPLYIAQIGVAVTKLDGRRIVVEEYQDKYVLFFPDSFKERQIEMVADAVREAALRSRLSLDLGLECYSAEDKRKPVEAARAQILASMHEMEVARIVDLAESERITRDSLLMIDGSLQFYTNLDRNREAFRNVVGVAKSFDLNRSVGAGNSAKQAGILAAELKLSHRTPAFRIKLRNLSIGAWYLRLHAARSHAGSDVTAGVIKLEMFPDNPTSGTPQPLNASRCNRLSRDILALRHPSTPWADARWASHLYPIYLTEGYIKRRFRSERTIQACL